MGVGGSVPGVAKPKPNLVIFGEVDKAEANGDQSDYPILKTRTATYIFDRAKGAFYDVDGNTIICAAQDGTSIENAGGNKICEIAPEMEPDSNATAAAAANMSVMYGKGFQKRVLSLSIKKHECVHFCKEINRPRANYVSLKPNEHTLEISYIGEKYTPSLFSASKSKRLYRKIVPMEEMVIWRVNNKDSDQGRVPIALVSNSMAKVWTERMTQLHIPDCAGVRIAPGVEHMIIFCTILLAHKARNAHAWEERRRNFTAKPAKSGGSKFMSFTGASFRRKPKPPGPPPGGGAPVSTTPNGGQAKPGESPGAMLPGAVRQVVPRA